LKILDKEVNLNEIIEFVFINENNYMELKQGRVYDWDKKYVYIDLDILDDSYPLENVYKIKRNKIKRIRKMRIDWWR
jgi:hypothetical protein